MQLPTQTFWAMIFSLMIGTPSLVFFGAIGSALTLSIHKGGALLSLLVLPLYIPILIFATSVIDTASANLAYNSQLSILAAICICAIISAPFAISASLKVSTN